MPRIVIAACLIWIVQGALLVVWSLVPVFSGGPIVVINTLIGGVLLLVGVLGLTGKISQLHGSAAVGAVVGILQLLSFAVLVFGGHERANVAVWRIALVAVNGAALVAAAILAMVGNTAYRTWRETKAS
jgi:hypothetical protein